MPGTDAPLHCRDIAVKGTRSPHGEGIHVRQGWTSDWQH